jgi:hypothetical protein
MVRPSTFDMTYGMITPHYPYSFLWLMSKPKLIKIFLAQVWNSENIKLYLTVSPKGVSDVMRNEKTAISTILHYVQLTSHQDSIY